MGLLLPRRPGPLANRAALCAACALASSVASSAWLLGCGGSSSESPWPVEPLESDKGPKGEALPGAQASDLASEEPMTRAGAGGSGGAEGALEPREAAGGAPSAGRARP